MRKFSKVTLIIAAVAGVTGLGLTVGGTAMGATVAGLDLAKNGWAKVISKELVNFRSRDNGTWEEDRDSIDELNTVESGEQKKVYMAGLPVSMDIKLSADQLSFEEYDGNELRIEVSGDNKDNVHVGKDDDELVIKGTGRTKDRNITVKYPKGYTFEDASIDVAAGTVEIYNDFAADDMEVSMSAGEFTNSGKLTVQNLDISVGTGDAEFKNLDVQDLEGECGIGNIELYMSRPEKDYDYEISCGAGSIEIGDSSYEGIGSEKKISNPGTDGTMKLECGIGTISVDFAES